MIDMTIPIDLSTLAGVTVGPISVGVEEDLYYRFVSDGPSAPSTAVLKMFSHRTAVEPGLEAATLTIDGTANTESIDGFRFVSFAVTTSEAAKRGVLHIFARKTQE